MQQQVATYVHAAEQSDPSLESERPGRDRGFKSLRFRRSAA